MSPGLGLLLALISVDGAGGEAAPPPPAVELRFDEAPRGAAPSAGDVQLVEYAPGQGPRLPFSPWGRGLDLTAAGRFGGGPNDRDKAGGAAIYARAGFAQAESFAVAIWARPSPAAAVNARILHKPGSWELGYNGGRPVFTVVADEKVGISFPSGEETAGGWLFLAASYNKARGELTLYRGARDGGLSPGRLEALAAAPAAGKALLEVGNFEGIRPFQGWIDEVRIFDVALAGPQVAAIFEADLARWRQGPPIYAPPTPPAAEPQFLPKASHIFCSTRWQERRKAESFQMLKTFHATHLLWVYGANPEYVREVHTLGAFYQGAINGQVGTPRAAADPDADTSGRQRDLDGRYVVLGHMQRWKNPPIAGCQNADGFRRLFFDEAEQLVKAGVDSIHVDDWEHSATAAQQGAGCFCDACMAGFCQYLQSLPPAERTAADVAAGECFDYRRHLKEAEGIADADAYRARYRDLPLTRPFVDFQRRSLRAFYTELRKRLNALSPAKYISLSVNGQYRHRALDGTLTMAAYGDLFDFLDGEASQSMQSFADYLLPCKLAEAVGLPQVMQTKPRRLGAAQAAMAATYGLGQWFLVPWDLYMDNDPATGQPAPRYYGAAADWAPLYDLVHQQPQLFEGFTTPAETLVLVDLDAPANPELRRVCQRLADLQTPFRIAAASSRYARLPLSASLLSAARLIIGVGPLEGLAEADRTALAAALAQRTARYVPAEGDWEASLDELQLRPLGLEAPANIHALLRVRADAAQPAAVVHLVNWNATAEGTAESFAHIGLTLADPHRWGKAIAATYYAPGQAAVPLAIEPHQGYWRLSVPRLRTWGIVEIRPQP